MKVDVQALLDKYQGEPPYAPVMLRRDDVEELLLARDVLKQIRGHQGYDCDSGEDQSYEMQRLAAEYLDKTS